MSPLYYSNKETSTITFTTTINTLPKFYKNLYYTFSNTNEVSTTYLELIKL